VIDTHERDTQLSRDFSVDIAQSLSRSSMMKLSSAMFALQTLHSSTTTSLNENHEQFCQRNEIFVNVKELK